MIRLVQGKATQAEQEEMQEMLDKILKKLPKDELPKKSNAEAA